MISFKQQAREEKQKELQELASKSAKEKFKYPLQSKKNIIDDFARFHFDNKEIPITNLKVSVVSNIIQYKTIDAVGDILERQGRDSIVVNCTATFITSLIPTKNDSWKSEDLYPKLYTEILDLCLKGKTAVLELPNLGIINAKLVSFTPNLDAKIRQGEMVELTFIEDFDISAEDLFNKFLSSEETAKEADELESTLSPPLTSLGIPKYKDTLFDSIRKVQNLINFPATAFSEISRDISQLRNRCKLNINAIKRNYNSSYARYNQLMYRLNADCNALTKQFETSQLPPNAQVLEFETTTKLSISELAKLLGTTFKVLFKLNPTLSNSYFVDAGTIVKYYKS